MQNELLKFNQIDI